MLGAWRTAHSLGATWRLRYNVPPNDPRFLDLEEEELLDDLLVLHFLDAEVRRAVSPGRAAAADLAGDEEDQQRLQASGAAFLGRADVQRALQRLHRGGTTSGDRPEAAAAPATIRLRVKPG